jgi:hypothetical protein
MAYIITQPTKWLNRPLGAEVVAMFGVFFALVWFYIDFFLWIIPMLVIFAFVTKFGSRRFLLVTGLGLLFALVQFPQYENAYGKAVLFIPNLNGTMLYVSSILNAATFHPVIVALTRSLFSASLVLTGYWLIKDSVRLNPHRCFTPDTSSESGLQFSLEKSTPMTREKRLQKMERRASGI